MLALTFALGLIGAVVGLAGGGLLSGAGVAAASTNISQGKPTTASSIENAGTPASAATDGNTGTRWSSAFSDPQWLQVDLGATASITSATLIWEAAYGKSFQIQTSPDAATWTSIYTTTTGPGGTQNLTITGSGRYVRMYGTVRANGYGYSLWEFQVFGSFATPTPTATVVPTATPIATPTGTAAACGTVNFAQGKTAIASSIENAGTPASAAVDGSTTTRWSSAASDPQWIQIDLGSTQTICKVVLNWETAYGKAFSIDVSVNATAWTSIYSTTTATGGIQTLNVSGVGRYIRMYGTARGTGYGYSLWEFQVFVGGPAPTPTVGPTATATVVPPTPTPTATPTGNWTTVWTTDFAGAANTAPTGADWVTYTGTSYPGGAANWGTGEVETDSASTANLYLDGNSHLVIKAIKDGSGNWTSGRIATQRTDFAANPGEQVKFTAVLQQPNVNASTGLGYWPGFRATGAAYRGNWNNWPAVGETDIMTDVNGRSQLSNTLHCGTAPDGPCAEYNGRQSGFASCVGCQTGYHEYSEIIDRSKTDEEVRFYLDGQQTWVVRESNVGVAAWQAAVDHGFFLSFNLSIGGSLPNAIAGVTTPTAATVSGASLNIDSVTVSKLAGTAPAAMTDPAIPAGPSVVKVTGTQGNWALNVNGSNYFIKGMTYGPPAAAADGYMRDLQNMGVNTIRIWGADTTTTPGLLQTASRFGIKTIVGFWLNQGADYLNDATYKTNTLNTIVSQVNALKGYQGVLLWDVGNEVILTTQNYTYPNGATIEQERVAYAQYVNQVVVAIHASDANHPVTSTDAWTGAWPYYKAYTPALDLMAVNSYGAVGSVKQDWINGNYSKPYILTEGGPAGEWEVPNDVNGVPTEPTDLQKRDGYTFSWNAILSHPGVALGATEFHYGTENDFGGVWLNTYTGGWRRLGYGALKQAYTGTPLANTAPQITAMNLSSQTNVPAGSQFTINVTASDPNGDPIRYNLMYSNKYITTATGFQNVTFTQTGNGTFSVTAPQDMGVWKVYVYAFDGKGNVGIETRSFKVTPPPVSGTNIAIGKTTTASSSQVSPAQPANYATDGNFATRWASDWSDPQWIMVDLGSTQTITHIQLAWDPAYGKSYVIETSTNGTTWTTIFSTTTGDGGFDDMNVSGSGRYVRLTGTVRGTAWGYSLWEFGIYH
jgi:hypothetical protein